MARATSTKPPPAPPTKKDRSSKNKKRQQQKHHGPAIPPTNNKPSSSSSARLPLSPPPPPPPNQPTDAQLIATIVTLTKSRHPPKTICPSEVPRSLCSAWRECMSRVRVLAIQLAKEGKIEITQGGQVICVDKEEEIKGPIRLRWREE